MTGAHIIDRPACWVFLILLFSYAFFWHSRDWNTASRLMLTYALVDRGTVAITGLEQQTNDKASLRRPVLLGQVAWLFAVGDAAIYGGEMGLSTPRATRSMSLRSLSGPPTTGLPLARQDSRRRASDRFSSCGHENWDVGPGEL